MEKHKEERDLKRSKEKKEAKKKQERLQEGKIVLILFY